MDVQNNCIILTYNKLSLIIIHMMSIFVIRIFIKTRVRRVIFEMQIAPHIIN